MDSHRVQDELMDKLRKHREISESIAAQRSDLLSSAWRAGHRNISVLARETGVSRDTVYSDLKKHGIYREADGLVWRDDGVKSDG